MKKLLYYLMLVVFIQSCEKSTTIDFVGDKKAGVPDMLSAGSWERLADYRGSSLYHNAGFGIGNKAYIGTGYFGGPLDEFWEYDLLTNSWAQIANFAGGKRTDAVGFSVGNKGYIFGGVGEDGLLKPFNDLWEYDPGLNTWTKKADLPAEGRFYAVGFSIDSYAYVATGNVIDTVVIDNCITHIVGVTDEFWQYSPLTNTWTRKAPFGGGKRADAAGFAIGNHGYVGVGYNPEGTFSKDFWEYDVTSNKWNKKADFGGVARAEAVALGINSLKRGYLGFGYGPLDPNNTGSLDDFWEYNPAKDEWIQRSTPGGNAFRNAVGLNFGDLGYVGPGATFGNEKTFWKFDPLN